MHKCVLQAKAGKNDETDQTTMHDAIEKQSNFSLRLCLITGVCVILNYMCIILDLWNSKDSRNCLILNSWPQHMKLKAAAI